ncbi:MAG: hypothetical protein IMZ64_14790, partial [Bacteroidetes bacterium]|nr:hypothetical protein [Bacteroidota bacterium]
MEKELVVKDRPLTSIEVRKQVNLIQEVMKNVMKEGEHYGKIPGCDKPSLLKSGAEKLAMTFRFAAEYEELPGSSEADNFIGYKINCKLIHIPTGLVVGNGRGTCNSKEKKFRTRSVYANKVTDEEKAIGKKEKRTTKDGKGYEVYIIPQDPWDVQNTLYKMACKRALIAAVLNATAASDIFTQDIEDLPEGTVLGSPVVVENHKPKVDMPKEKPIEQKAAEEVFNAEEIDNGINVLEALDKKVDETFDVWGILFDHKSIITKTKKDITYYQLAPRDSTEIIEIAKFGKLSDGISSG